MSTEEKTYLQGFNEGYKLNKYNPDLYEKLIESLGEETEYNQGFKEGGEQAEREREKSRQAELDELRDDQEPEQDIER